MQKADFARATSTTFDQYAATMKNLGIHVRVEDKNISYNYGDSAKAVRGKHLGTKFDKAGLIKVFKENDEKFAKHGELRDKLRAELGKLYDPKGNLVGTPSHLLLESASHTRFGKKDYGQYTKLSRSNTRHELSSTFGNDGILPLEEIKKAKSRDILDYCKRNNIAVHVNQQGKSVLKGREYIVIEGSTWKNTKNHTVGSAIDFVAYHHDETFLRAVARLNDDPRLLLLETVIGQVKRSYTSFYIPKEKQMSTSGTYRRLKSFSQTSGLSHTQIDDLMKLNRLQVTHEGAIWLFAGTKGEHAIEFTEASGKVTKRRHGNTSLSFYEKKGSGHRVVIFADPFAHITSPAHAKKVKSPDSLIVPLSFDSQDSSLSRFLAQNSRIKYVDIVFGPDNKHRTHEKAEVERLKKILDPFSIQVRGIELTDIARTRGRDFDIDL